MINISQPSINDEETKAVKKVLESGMLAQGPVVKKLEEEFAKYIGVKYAVAVSSGTAAIHAGLSALGVGPGDEVITTPFTFVATANPILMLGAKVVFADINEEDFNINPSEVKKKITKRTKAVIPVDLFGQVYDFKRIKKLADKNSLKILEDACQAIGASRDGKKAGRFADVAAFSLYATKNIMCGEGGMIVTNDEAIYKTSKKLRHHGRCAVNGYTNIGYNYRMTDLAAAIAREQLKKIDGFSKKREENAKKLTKGLSNIGGLILPKTKKDSVHAFNHYTVRITDDFKIKRDELLAFLRKKGINCGVYYDKPLHLQPLFKKMGYKEGDFPVAEKAAKEVLSIPVHPMVSTKDIKYIIESIREYGK